MVVVGGFGVGGGKLWRAGGWAATAVVIRRRSRVAAAMVAALVTLVGEGGSGGVTVLPSLLIPSTPLQYRLI